MKCLTRVIRHSELITQLLALNEMKKRGKRIKQDTSVLPLGIKNTKYELEARLALVALRNDVATQQCLVDLWVLADICSIASQERHIQVHAESVKRLCDEIYQADYSCTSMQSVGMDSSAGVLIDFFNSAKNKVIADATTESIRRWKKSTSSKH